VKSSSLFEPSSFKQQYHAKTADISQIMGFSSFASQRELNKEKWVNAIANETFITAKTKKSKSKSKLNEPEFPSPGKSKSEVASANVQNKPTIIAGEEKVMSQMSLTTISSQEELEDGECSD